MSPIYWFMALPHIQLVLMAHGSSALRQKKVGHVGGVHTTTTLCMVPTNLSTLDVRAFFSPPLPTHTRTPRHINTMTDNRELRITK